MKNFQNKTLNALLNAFLINSFIFLPNVPPYSDLQNIDGVNDLLYKTPDECYDKIKNIITNKQYADNINHNIREFSKEYFSSKNNERILASLLHLPSKVLSKKTLAEAEKKLQHIPIVMEGKKRYKFLGITFLKIKSSKDRIKYYILGLPIIKIKKSTTKNKYIFLGLPITINRMTVKYNLKNLIKTIQETIEYYKNKKWKK